MAGSPSVSSSASSVAKKSIIFSSSESSAITAWRNGLIVMAQAASILVVGRSPLDLMTELIPQRLIARQYAYRGASGRQGRTRGLATTVKMIEKYPLIVAAMKHDILVMLEDGPLTEGSVLWFAYQIFTTKPTAVVEH
jgi:hypothetical protein